MPKKLRVAILFGGKSAEHDVSCRSAKNIFDAMDRNKYEPSLIEIDKQGRWIVPGASAEMLPSASVFADVVFPVLHGPFGEDGTVQGLLKLADVPFVGAGVLGSAVGMDKDVMKRLLRDANIPVAKFLVYHLKEKNRLDFKEIVSELGLPFFVKPANLGSSVGISKVHNEQEFAGAVEMAFQFDKKIIVESHVEGREIECAILGNDQPAASVLGEIIPTHEFYSYEAKYLDENGAAFRIPADIEPSAAKEIQDMAINAFQILCCEGMARVDFFLTRDGKIFVNEINTIPGFTSISMYPKLWEQSGVAYPDLIDRLIQLALERFETDRFIAKTPHSSILPA